MGRARNKQSALDTDRFAALGGPRGSQRFWLDEAILQSAAVMHAIDELPQQKLRECPVGLTDPALAASKKAEAWIADPANKVTIPDSLNAMYDTRSDPKWAGAYGAHGAVSAASVAMLASPALTDLEFTALTAKAAKLLGPDHPALRRP